MVWRAVASTGVAALAAALVPVVVATTAGSASVSAAATAFAAATTVAALAVFSVPCIIQAMQCESAVSYSRLQRAQTYDARANDNSQIRVCRR